MNSSAENINYNKPFLKSSFDAVSLESNDFKKHYTVFNMENSTKEKKKKKLLKKKNLAQVNHLLKRPFIRKRKDRCESFYYFLLS